MTPSSTISSVSVPTDSYRTSPRPIRAHSRFAGGPSEGRAVKRNGATMGPRKRSRTIAADENTYPPAHVGALRNENGSSASSEQPTGRGVALGAMGLRSWVVEQARPALYPATNFRGGALRVPGYMSLYGRGKRSAASLPAKTTLSGGVESTVRLMVQRRNATCMSGPSLAAVPVHSYSRGSVRPAQSTFSGHIGASRTRGN